MEKKITLAMQASKDIDVAMNDTLVFSIPHDNRSITAEALFMLFSYSRGDKYTIESINEKNLDAPVLAFFSDLIKDIADRLNRLGDDTDSEEGYNENNTGATLDFIEEAFTNVDDNELPF